MDDRRANSSDANPLETIWIIVDGTTYKDPAPKNTGLAMTVTTLRLEKCEFRHALEACTLYTSPLRKCHKS